MLVLVNPFVRQILTFVAGFCDTVTFIQMGGVFCAHVTGNFVLFAASVARGIRGEDYLKIAAFPVFVLGVLVATLLVHRWKRLKREWLRNLLGSVAALILIAALGTLSTHYSIEVVVTLVLVFAMGMQNTIHHFTPGPMTTVMTGTVMNTTAGLTERFFVRRYEDCEPPPVGTGVGMGVTFLLGCTLGALGAAGLGLRSLALPAGLMLIATWSSGLDRPKDR